jgi:hypothetical protein
MAIAIMPKAQTICSGESIIELLVVTLWGQIRTLWMLKESKQQPTNSKQLQLITQKIFPYSYCSSLSG